MIKPAFHIEHEESSEDDYLQSLLLMEVNHHGLSYLVLHQVRQEVLDAKYYALHGHYSKTLSDRFRTIIDTDPVLNNQFRESMVLYNFAESLLAPESNFNLEVNRDLIELTYGTVSKGLILSEKIPGHPVYNIYRVAPDIHSLYQQKFTAGKYWHIYTLWLSSLKSFPPDADHDQPQLHAMFYPDKMLVAVYKRRKLQLVQTYLYQVPEDVVYYLLNICTQLEMSPEEVLLMISGYAEENSALITEVRKYFLDCKMDQVPQTFTNGVFDPLPVHFFSSLLKMALCV
jgi:Protein of unknown function (DUF3822)